MLTHEKQQYTAGWKKRKKRKEKMLAKKKQQALNKVSKIAECLYGKYSASRVILFGSLVSGQFREHSDIDILVEGIEEYNYFEVASEIMDIAFPFKIDLLPWSDIESKMRERIEREGVEL